MQGKAVKHAFSRAGTVSAVLVLLLTRSTAIAFDPKSGLQFPGIADRLTLLGVILVLALGWIYLVNRLRRKADEKEKEDRR